jgi:hypothetical protein
MESAGETKPKQKDQNFTHSIRIFVFSEIKTIFILNIIFILYSVTYVEQRPLGEVYFGCCVKVLPFIDKISFFLSNCKKYVRCRKLLFV